jgi:hypothetical protein
MLYSSESLRVELNHVHRMLYYTVPTVPVPVLYYGEIHMQHVKCSNVPTAILACKSLVAKACIKRNGSRRDPLIVVFI